MSGPVCALAARLPTSFVSLDEGASQNGFERGELTHKSVAAFSKRGGGLFLYIHQTTYQTGPIIEHSNRLLSTFFLPPRKLFQKCNQIE